MGISPEVGMTAVQNSPEVQGISFIAFVVGFFFSFRSALVMIFARWFGLGTEPGVIASLSIECALLLAISFQAAGPAKRSLHWIARQSTIRWVFLFLAFSCSSLLWSATVSRPASFLYWCAMSADVAGIVLLLRSEPVSEVAHSLMRGFIWSTCVLAGIAWIMPASQDLRLGDQDYFNTNQIGNLCAMAIFMAQFLAGRKVGRWRLPIALLTVTLLRSLSKATIVGFVVAEAFLLIYDKSISRRKKVALACAALVLIAAFGGLIVSYFDAYTTTGNQAETLTGRTVIWAYTLGASLEKPWFGNGIDAMWKVFPPFGKEMFEARHAENELLQQFFAYGVAGVIMLAGLYGSLLRRIRSVPRDGSRAILLSIIIFILVRGLAEAEPFDLLLPLWMIVLMSCVVEDTRASRERESSTSFASPGVHSVAISGSPAL
jgi:exopolysaccharide production protein ExoQ